MLVIVHVGRILQIPRLPCHGDGNLTQSLTRGAADRARIALVFMAQSALGIARGRQQTRCGDRLGILFGLGEIDRDIQRAVFALVLPAEVFGNAVGADIVAVAAELIEIVGRGLGIVLVKRAEGADDLTGSGGHGVHQRGIVKVTVHHGIGFDQALLVCIVAHLAENLVKRHAGHLLFGLCVFGQSQRGQQRIDHIGLVLAAGQLAVDGVVHKGADKGMDVHVILPSKAYLSKDNYSTQDAGCQTDLA